MERPRRGGGESDQCGGLPERIGHVRVADQAVRQRDGMEQHDGERAGEPVTPVPHDRRVKQQTGDRFRGRDTTIRSSIA